MFKTNLFSIFGKPKGSHKQTSDSGEIPRAFTIKDDKNAGPKSASKLLNISMDNDLEDDFVTINMNEMTYADVANMNQKARSGNVIQSIRPVEVKINKSHKSRSKARGLDDDDMEDSIHEKFKSDVHYKKHKQFKANEKKKNKKKKLRT